ncbi:MAG: ATP-binding protein [Prevotellaceae bacterium]|jgi:AAA+ ATPase superfamily predicted ATPase|nr:ATP-binding protein [Prevotellaceae bacterium]
MKRVNPFVTKGYVSAELFCDREKEIKVLKSNVRNSINTTLISVRRMGKTGLIYRFFDEINAKNNNFITIYVDIFSARSLDDFVKLLAEAILKFYPEKTSFGQIFMKFIKGLRPLISYNGITGEPQIQIIYQTSYEKEATLRNLFEFLERQDKKIILAIDEFQQITEFSQKNIEALLRTYIQPLNNIDFIFCGSQKTMMLDIFSNAKRPFFGMTQYLHLDRIDEDKYLKFIKKLFSVNNKNIETQDIQFILEWTNRHTYYTQSLCNEVYNISSKNIDINKIKEACAHILIHNEPIYLQYRQLLTSAQWNFLIAVAKEEKVTQITAQNFISKYNIGSPANAKRICKALVDKDLLFANADFKAITYQVQDVFLMRWLQSKFS